MTAIMITVGKLTENGAESLEHYAQGVIPLLEAAGVRILGRYQGLEPLVGEDLFDLVSVMEFPDERAMSTFLSSAAYQAMVPHRNQAFEFIRTFACQVL